MSMSGNTINMNTAIVQQMLHAEALTYTELMARLDYPDTASIASTEQPQQPSFGSSGTHDAEEDRETQLSGMYS